MITNPNWLKPKEKPYFHQISLGCIEKVVNCIERFNKGKIDADTSSKIEKQRLEMIMILDFLAQYALPMLLFSIVMET